MSVSVESIKKLNERIEKLNIKKTKADTQREMLISQLNKAIAEYESSYGVNLKGSSLKATIKRILEENKRVGAEIESEYTLKEKVVQALESGNIEVANTLLGISSHAEDSDEEYDDTELSDVKDEDDFDDLEDIEDIMVSETDDAEDVEDIEDIEDVEATEDAEDVKPTTISSVKASRNSGAQSFMTAIKGIDASDVFDLDDEDATDNKKPAKSSKSSKKSTTGGVNRTTTSIGRGADEVLKELDTDSIEDIKDEDIDDMDIDDDFGFGGLLSGTKFDI